MGDYSALVDDTKISMIDLSPDESPPASCDIVQLKYDGWFSILRIRHGIMQVITSGGEVRREISVGFAPNATLIAEWIYGTNWSKLPAQDNIFDKFIIHNMFYHVDMPRLHELNYGEVYKRAVDYVDRHLNFLGANDFLYAHSFSVNSWKTLWENEVMNKGYEGLIFKNSKSILSCNNVYRMKKVITFDYVVMGFNEGKNRLSGTLGSLVGGLYINGELTKVCTVGGGFDDNLRDIIWNNREEYRGKVMEVSGKVLFDSGALRHPAFMRFRDDKLPEQCRPARILQE